MSVEYGKCRYPACRTYSKVTSVYGALTAQTYSQQLVLSSIAPPMSKQIRFYNVLGCILLKSLRC